MRSTVSRRLQREGRLNASPYTNRATIDDELSTIREHPEKIAAFLKDQEEIYGESIVARRGADRCDVTFPFLIQLLCEYPDGLEPVATAVEIVPRPGEEIERGVRGEAPD